MSNEMNDELEGCLRSFISKLNSFQVRAFQKKPLKAKRQRRLVYGLREILKNIERIKVVIAAKDLDEDFSTSDYWIRMKDKCNLNGISIIFGLGKKEISLAVAENPRIHISIVGVLSLDGCYETFQSIKEIHAILEASWIEQKKLVKNIDCIAAHYGHISLLKSTSCDGFMSDTGDTPIHIAASVGYLSIVKQLIISSESVMEKNYSLQYPTHLAAKSQHRDIFSYFEGIYGKNHIYMCSKDAAGLSPQEYLIQ